MASKVQNPSDPLSSQRETWERWVIVWHIVFYLSLGLSLFFALTADDLRYDSWVVLVLSLALGIWYAVIIVWYVPKVTGAAQTAWSLVYLVIAVVLWFPLARSHWAYFITASSFYGLMWGTLPFGLAVTGNIVLTGLIIWVQALNMNKPISLSLDLVLIGLVALGWSALLALWMRSVMRESTERKRLIEQLQAAQDSLAAAERQSGILQERQRLAHEIHDTLAQSFTSIVMQLEAAEAVLPAESGPAQSHVARARDTARVGLGEARRLVQALRPAQLDDATLVEALRRVVARWQGESGIEVGFTVTGEPQALHPDLEVTLLRSVQEGLTNIRKHARASVVNVTLSYMNDQIALDIQDDGCGFDPGKTGTGYGLQAMRERIAQLQGEVFIESAPEAGTTVAIQVPMEVPLE